MPSYIHNNPNTEKTEPGFPPGAVSRQETWHTEAAESMTYLASRGDNTSRPNLDDVTHERLPRFVREHWQRETRRREGEGAEKIGSEEIEGEEAKAKL